MAEKTVTQRIDLNELKSGGFIKQNQKDLFTVRLKVLWWKDYTGKADEGCRSC